MDITKYITNKDIQLSNDDLNIEKLEKDLRKGYILESESENAIKDAISSNSKESTSKYLELEKQFNDLQKNYDALAERNTTISNSNKDLALQVEMVSQGFNKEQFKEISQLRSSMFGEEQDDAKAISLIKDKFGATYFPNENKVDIPNEVGLGSKASTENHEINITRKTKLADIMKK